MTPTTDPLPFRSAAVLGAGVMGAQIAAHLANAGLTVDLLDIAAADGPKNAHVESLFARARKIKPPPFFTDEAVERVRLGNFEEHWDRLAAVDWVVEAVIENMQVKQEIAERIEDVVRDDAVVSTNTSGLQIEEIAAGRSPAFRRRFLATHFFNPPRYMKLLEIVPLHDSDEGVVTRVREFGRLHLGKGVVIAKDTPYFIANRIGVYAILQSIREMIAGGYTFEEVDALTGPLIGHPKSATLRTCDVVGLDTMVLVAQNLHDAVPDDESRDAFVVPEIMAQLVDGGALGAKAKRGFYTKDKKQILSFDSDSGEYRAPAPLDVGDLVAIKKAGDVGARMRALWQDQGRAGAFFRATTLDLLGYSARRIPEITDSPADLDRAVCWGFGHEIGPFETWDALGFGTVLAELQAREPRLPSWVDDMARDGAESFYRERDGEREVYVPGRGYTRDPRPADEIALHALRREPKRVLWEGAESALIDLGDGVACYEFRSKANTLTTAVMHGLRECIDHVEAGDYRGLVIGNDGQNFSPGANLVEMATAADAGAFDEIDEMIRNFQAAVQRVHYATKPVVLATRGLVLGGACEILMACRHPVVAAESYIGLVETGAGLIPAGCGTMRMVAWAADRAASHEPRHVLPYLEAAFETLARAMVSGSAPHAQQLGFVHEDACIVPNADRRLFVAKEEVLRLAAEGYAPPPERVAVRVLGKPARERFEAGLQQLRESGNVDEYSAFLGGRLAWVMTGGDLDGPADLHEQQLLDLEREVFVGLLGEEGTQQRIAAIVGPKR